MGAAQSTVLGSSHGVMLKPAAALDGAGPHLGRSDVQAELVDFGKWAVTARANVEESYLRWMLGPQERQAALEAAPGRAGVAAARRAGIAGESREPAEGAELIAVDFRGSFTRDEARAATSRLLELAA